MYIPHRLQHTCASHFSISRLSIVTKTSFLAGLVVFLSKHSPVNLSLLILEFIHLFLALLARVTLADLHSSLPQICKHSSIINQCLYDRCCLQTCLNVPCSSPALAIACRLMCLHYQLPASSSTLHTASTSSERRVSRSYFINIVAILEQ
jgi:hypothetical protein